MHHQLTTRWPLVPPPYRTFSALTSFHYSGHPERNVRQPFPFYGSPTLPRDDLLLVGEQTVCPLLTNSYAQPPSEPLALAFLTHLIILLTPL